MFPAKNFFSKYQQQWLVIKDHGHVNRNQENQYEYSGYGENCLCQKSIPIAHNFALGFVEPFITFLHADIKMHGKPLCGLTLENVVFFPHHRQCRIEQTHLRSYKIDKAQSESEG